MSEKADTSSKETHVPNKDRSTSVDPPYSASYTTGIKGSRLLVDAHTQDSIKLMKDLRDHPTSRAFCLRKQQNILCEK
ncbi:hypothetical protein MTR_8g030820 [Medicago truncatula]|uniref:Uncharacterized protein n=1 Tax=Medicago truncatula TaxID=3880 RepID=A0A072TN11_MEDTR|nr:hypothetical protein MTR_8g030820 [Medicago truncatula]